MLILPGEREPVAPAARSADERLVLRLASGDARPDRPVEPEAARASRRAAPGPLSKHTASSEVAASPPARQPTAPSAAEELAIPRDTGDTPLQEQADAAMPSSVRILQAAKREAALVAYELNHAEETRLAFRSTVQDDLDRHFAAAREAGQGWLRAARITELTRTSDGATRIYRITTPLGAFCMTYHGGSGKPTYGNCPR